MIASPGRGHLRPLTSLRFVAASLIFLVHVRGQFGVSPEFGEPFLFGQGVSFFFVLSGFILVYVYRELDHADARRFWVARFARIWPAHVAALLLLLLLLPATRPAADAASAGSLLTNLFLVHTWRPPADQWGSFNSVSWSVSTELGFYLCFPLLLISWRRTWHWKLACTLLLTIALIALGNAGYFPVAAPNEQGFRDILFLHVHPLARLFEFTLGMSAALAWERLAAREPVSYRAASLWEILAVLFVVFLMYHSAAWAEAAGRLPWVGDAGWAWLSVGGIPALGFAILITVLALQAGVISRVLSLPLLVLLGEISFSIYLIHQVLIRYALGNAHSLGIIPPLLQLSLLIAITLLMSYVMWWLVEQPLRAVIVARFARQGRAGLPHPDRSARATPASSMWPFARARVISLVALVALIAPMVYLLMFRDTLSRVTPAYATAVAAEAPGRLRNVTFGDAFQLVGVKTRPAADGVELELVWQSARDQHLDYLVAVHVVDADGNILANSDYPQDPLAPWVSAGTLWRDIVHLPADQLAGSKAIAIGLYRPPAGLLPVASGPRDAAGQRLLIVLKRLTLDSGEEDLASQAYRVLGAASG